MKTSGSMIQGALLPSAYPAFAKYFVQFVKEYEAAGVPIYAITMQNEPKYIPNDYPGMNMTSREQIEVLANYVGPAFRDVKREGDHPGAGRYVEDPHALPRVDEVDERPAPPRVLAKTHHRADVLVVVGQPTEEVQRVTLAKRGHRCNRAYVRSVIPM